MRVLVTGAGGFVGQHLIPKLIQKGHQVVAGGIRDSHTWSSKGIQLRFFDITNDQMLKALIREVQPEGIIHLAAQSMVNRAWKDPAGTVQVNIIGTINLMQAVQDIVPRAKIISIGSGEEYGLSAKKGQPLAEYHSCLPQNPYATSKLASGQIEMQMAQRDGLNVIHVRAFNHFGPGQPVGFVVSDFCWQIVNIEHGLMPPIIKVGNLSAVRDFTYVHDVVEAYVLLLERPLESGVYNVCSGQPRKIGDILDFLVDHAQRPISVEIDPEKFRPSEVPMFVGCNKKIKHATGWEPQGHFHEGLRETLEWWRDQYNKRLSRQEKRCLCPLPV